MAEFREYKERFWMACQKYKNGRFFPVRASNSTKVNYWQCEDCHGLRQKMKSDNKKIQTYPPTIAIKPK